MGRLAARRGSASPIGEHRLVAELRDALGITDERLVALGYAAQLLRASGEIAAS
jgi:hypothetical protein